MRILPRTNDDINEEWISDKTRHVVDGLRTQRLDQPYVREGGKLRPATWTEAFNAIAAKVGQGQSQAHGRHGRRPRRGRGDFRAQGFDDAAWRRQSRLPAGRRGARSGLGQGQLSVQRHHCRNRFRRRACSSSAPIRARKPPFSMRASASAGAPGNFRSASSGRRPISPTPTIISAPARKRSPPSRGIPSPTRLRKAERPLVLLGAGALTRGDGAAIASLAAKAALDLGAVKEGWNGFCVLHSAASRVGALDLGFRAGAGRALRAADGGVRHARCSVPARRRRDRHRAGRLRRLYRHPWRPRRDARRCGAAGRRLSGKIGDLCQHRGPGADGDARVVPAGRRARRLGDLAGAVGRAGTPAAL